MRTDTGILKDCKDSIKRGESIVARDLATSIVRQYTASDLARYLDAYMAENERLRELLGDANAVECVNLCAVQRGSTIKNPLIKHTVRCDKQRAALAASEVKG